MKAGIPLLIAATVLVASEAAAVECIAHRGLSIGFPENSMAAITNALTAGAGIVEVDVRITADGILVLHHDADRDGRKVGAMTYEELLAASSNSVLELRAALGLWPDQGGLLLDVKEDSTELLAVLRECIDNSPVDARRIMFQSRSMALLDRIRRHFPASQCFFVTSLDRSGIRRTPPSAHRLARELDSGGLDGVSAKGRRFIDSNYVAEFQNRGLAFFVWTINPPDRMEHYLELGVDGIITDRSDVLRDLMLERNGEQDPVPQPFRRSARE